MLLLGVAVGGGVPCVLAIPADRHTPQFLTVLITPGLVFLICKPIARPLASWQQRGI